MECPFRPSRVANLEDVIVRPFGQSPLPIWPPQPAGWRREIRPFCCQTQKETNYEPFIRRGPALSRQISSGENAATTRGAVFIAASQRRCTKHRNCLQCKLCAKFTACDSATVCRDHSWKIYVGILNFDKHSWCSNQFLRAYTCDKRKKQIREVRLILAECFMPNLAQGLRRGHSNCKHKLTIVRTQTIRVFDKEINPLNPSKPRSGRESTFHLHPAWADWAQ